MAQVTNCLIFGSGRCATSALAGALAHSGAFTGYHILGPTPHQLWGYFEDRWVNTWNDEALRASDPDFRGLFITPVKLSLPELGSTFADMGRQLRPYFWMQPYALKDPRFAFTYPIWKPYLVQPCVSLVLFRNPSDFAASAVRLRADYGQISGDTQALLEMWKNSYDHVLANDDGTFHYFEFDRIVTGAAYGHLEKLLGYEIDRTHIKSGEAYISDTPCPEEMQPLYRELQKRANSV